MNKAAQQLAASDQGCVPILFRLIRSLADELEVVRWLTNRDVRLKRNILYYEGDGKLALQRRVI